MANIKELAESLVNLTVSEVNELTKILKDDYGIEPAAQAMVVGASADSGSGAPAAEQTEFDVILQSAGANKLAVVKAVKEITGLSLKDAKELVDTAPKPLKEKANKADAEELKKKLEEFGAQVELK